MEKDLINTADAAKILDVDTSTLRKWRQRKLFGCTFFDADVKVNGAWFYYRDRVEQLKAVYNKGILQNMYKLAQLETDKIKLFDFCVTSRELQILKEIILDVDDVAEILSITARQVQKLCKENKLDWYGEHDGTYWLNAYDVYKFKADRDAQKKNSPSIHNAVDFLLTYFKDSDGYSYLWCNHKAKKIKVTIPFKVDDRAEIAKAVARAEELNSKNYDVYFGVNVGNKPTDEYHRYSDTEITRQVAIVADIDVATDGHHKDKNLPPNIDTAKSFLPIPPTFLTSTGGGVHAYYKFNSPVEITDKDSATLLGKKFLDVIRSKANGFGGIDAVQDLPRVLRLPFTYNCKDTDNRKLCTILHVGDTVTVEQIDSLFLYNANSANLSNSNFITNDFDRALALAALDAIPTAETAANGGSDWLAVNSACKNLGLNAEVDAWNRRDLEHYDEMQNKRRYDSLKDSSFGLDTLIGIAKRFGFDAAEFKRNWFNKHPKEKADNLKNQLRDVKQKIDDFEKEKNSAIETLKNVENFDNKTVFSDEIINAAAFAKRFDLQTYSVFYRDLKSFGDKHRAEKVNLNDFTRLVNNTAELITDRQNKLKAELILIKGKIANENFIADNPELHNITIPNGYYFSLSEGVTKIVDDKGNTAQVCFSPIIIARKTKNIDTKTFKLILQFWTRDGRKITLPAMPASSIFNARKLIDAADFGLPINSLLAFRLTEYLDSYKFQNENLIPTTCIAPRCGWYNFNGSDIFVDPRRNSTITDDDTDCPLIVDSQSTFAQSLTTKGTLENWIRAYNLAKFSPIARLTVAAAVAPPLLKILGERNFLLYVYGQTRSGKSTAMYLSASAVGDENIIRNFDGTKNGLIGAAADVSDYPFFVDEKQSADPRLQDSMALIVYSWSNGVGRTKLNKDSSLRKLENWTTIAIANGETPLFSDNVTGGAYTRALQLHAPNTILDADTCKQIRDIIKDNYGHITPVLIEKIFEYGKDFLREQYKIITDSFAKAHSDILPEYKRYIAVITLADALLNNCLGVDDLIATKDALNNARAIFKLTPTTTDIDDTTRETDFIFGFIAQNQSRFIGGNVDLEKMQMIFGKIKSDCVYITVAAMKQACTDGGFNYDKVVNDLIAANIIIPSDKIKKGRKKPLITHVVKIENVAANCYKLINPNRFSDTE